MKKKKKKKTKSNKILTTYIVTLSPSRLQPVLDCARYPSNPIITWAGGIQTFVASTDTWSIIDQLLIN